MTLFSSFVSFNLTPTFITSYNTQMSTIKTTQNIHERAVNTHTTQSIFCNHHKKSNFNTTPAKKNKKQIALPFRSSFINTTIVIQQISLNKIKIMHHRRSVVVLLPLLKPPLPPPLKQKQRINQQVVCVVCSSRQVGRQVHFITMRRENVIRVGGGGERTTRGGQRQRGYTTTPVASSRAHTHTHPLYIVSCVNNISSAGINLVLFFNVRLLCPMSTSRNFFVLFYLRYLKKSTQKKPSKLFFFFNSIKNPCRSIFLTTPIKVSIKAVERFCFEIYPELTF